MFDGPQELAVFQGLQKLGAYVGDFAAAPEQVPDQVVQTPGVHPGLALKALQGIDLVVEFLVYLAAQVAAGQYRQDIEQRRNCGSCGPAGFVLAVVQHLLIQELESQERTHALAERKLVKSGPGRCLGRDFSRGFRHRRILNDVLLAGK
jgi:hypothetical protein